MGVDPVLRLSRDHERPVPPWDEKDARPAGESCQPVGVGRGVEEEVRRPDGPCGKRRKPRDARGRRAGGDDDGVGPKEPLRRLDPSDAPRLDVRHRESGGTGDERARPPGCEKEGSREPRRGELAVPGKGERGPDGGRESRLPCARFLGREDLEGKRPRPLPVERAVEEDLLGLCHRRDEAAPDVVFADEPRLLLERLDPLPEEASREEGKVPKLLRRGAGSGLRVDGAGRKRRRPGGGPLGVAEVEDDRLDSAPGESQAEGEARETGPEDDNVGSSRRRPGASGETQETSPFASRTGPAPGISGGP